MEDVVIPKTKYSCPMHPEIVSDEPKRCWKCGMKLESFQPRAPQTPQP